MSEEEPTQEEIIRRIKYYHQLQEKRGMKSYFDDFVDDGHTLEFRASITPWGGRKPGKWWNEEEKRMVDIPPIERSEKSKFREYVQNKKQIELEDDRKDRAERVKRLTESYRVKNVKKLKASTVVDHDEYMKTDFYDNVKTPTDSSPISPFSESCRIRLKLIDGTIDTVEFQTEDKLERILEYCVSQYGKPKNDETYLSGIALQRRYPPKVFTNQEVEKVTILEAGVANGNVNVIRKGGGYQMKANPVYQNYKEELLPKWRLKGEDIESKLEYKEKVRRKRVQEMMEDKKRTRESLRRVREQIKADKKRRREKRKEKERLKKNKNYYSSKTKTSSTVVKKEEVSSSSLTIQIRVDGGQKVVHVFSVNDTFKDVEDVLVEKIGLSRMDDFSFVIPYPRRNVAKFQFGSLKLTDCSGLYPKGTIVLNRQKNSTM